MGHRQKIKPEPSLIFENVLMIKRREQINLTEWHKRRKDLLEYLRFCYSNHYSFSLLLLLIIIILLYNNNNNNTIIISCFMRVKEKKENTTPYFAYVLRSLIWSVAEFPTNLEVTDTAN